MGIELRMPSINGNEREQLIQIRSYLYQLIPQLQWALNNVNATELSSGAVEQIARQISSAAVSGSGGTSVNAETIFANLKPLIIKSADIVQAYYEEIDKQLNSSYFAGSDFGTFIQQTNQSIKATSDYVDQTFENVQVIITNEIDDVKVSVGEDMSNLNTSFNNALGVTDQRITEEVAALNSSIDETNEEIGNVNSRVDATNILIGTTNERINQTNARIDGVNTSIAETNEEIRGVNNLITEANGKIDGLTEAINDTNDSIKALEDATDVDLTELNSELSKINGSIDEISTNIEKVDGQINDINGSVANVEELAAGLNESVGNVEKSIGETNAKVDDTSGAVANLQATAEETSKKVNDLDSAIEDVNKVVASVNTMVVETFANIKSGLLDDAVVPPVYGVEVGQTNTVNGVEVFRKFARFTADRLSFYDQNEQEVAYISDYKLYIRNVEITISFKMGRLVDTVMSNGDVVTKCVGGEW